MERDFGYTISLAQGRQAAILFPAGTRNTQIQDAFVTYFMAHPAEREKEGALVIFAAIKARWPCPEK